MNKTKQYALFYDPKGSVTIKLPVGESTDQNRLFLYVRIINDLGTITVHEIDTPVSVTVDSSFATSLTTQLTSSADGSSAIMSSLQNADQATAMSQVLAIASIVSTTADQVNRI